MSDGTKPTRRFLGATDIDHRPDLLGFGVAEPSAEVEGATRPLLPLAEVGVADAGESRAGMVLERVLPEGHPSGSC
jgi:hypothetical protein